MGIKYISVLFSILFLTIATKSKIIYTEPCDGAKLVNIENNIIIGFDKTVPFTAKAISDCITVEGEKSGLHSGKYFLTGDNRKIIFTPSYSFARGEKVSVSISGKLSKINTGQKELKYYFETSPVKPEADMMQIRAAELGVDAGMLYNPVFSNPPVVPPLTVTVNNNPENGFIFLGNFTGSLYQPYLIITNKNGSLYYSLQTFDLNFDFKKQPNGNLTYFENSSRKFLELNTNYAVVNSYYTGNGYQTDEHELRVLPNRHALLLSYDFQIVNMSEIVPGGQPNATVVGLIVQEIDENKNVVFQWRSWDHFQITDALHENLTSGLIDYVHGNAIEIDNDSNIIISSRNMDEITKINRSTGAIIWRWGGRNNQFTFINDTLRFCYQHAIRRINNGNVTLFDNGNFHTPKVSRALEYNIDEINKTATLVWEYRHTPSIFSAAMGYMQRLPAGNTLIGWGMANTTVTEVTPQKTIAFEMNLPVNIYTYRVFKFDWNGPPTSTGGQSENIPVNFSLKQNQPNPFNPATTISFEIPRREYTELVVSDATGRIIKQMVSENLNPGKYNFIFDGSNLASGIYFYKLQAGDFSASKIMVLVK